MTLVKRSVKGTSLTFNEMDENFRDLRFDTDIDRVLENGNTTTRDLTVGDLTVGGLAYTSRTYLSGEIIEMVAGVADGSSMATQTGSVTFENHATNGYQVPGLVYENLIGSTVTYTPPAVTKRVIYECTYSVAVLLNPSDTHGIGHFKFQIDGVDVTHSKFSIGGATYPEHLVTLKWVINCNASSADVTTGSFTSWTTPKVLRVVTRNFSAGNEMKLGAPHHHDGASYNTNPGSGRYFLPNVSITAIA